jgi:threonine dehydratase
LSARGQAFDLDRLAAAIEAAHERIAGLVRETPVLQVDEALVGHGAPVALKLELLQHTGSFKPRGAFNGLLGQRVPPSGVIAASGGNHGAAVAYAARVLGHRAEIFVPEIASPVKVRRLRDLGAVVTVTGADYAEALAACEARQCETGALSVHAYDQWTTVAGQGSVARELEDQLGRFDTVVVAVGGGGLIGGIAGWLRDRCRVVGVSGIAADSLGARRIGEIAFAVARAHVDEVVLVDDAEVADAQARLWEQVRVVAEPGGATALAGLCSGSYRPAPGERVAVIVCGGNTDPAGLGRRR